MGTNWDEWFNKKHPHAISKVTLLECVWTDCPVEVQDEVRQIWLYNEFGNDYYYPWNWEEDSSNYLIINNYLIEQGATTDDKVLIHWWW